MAEIVAPRVPSHSPGRSVPALFQHGLEIIAQQAEFRLARLAPPPGKRDGAQGIAGERRRVDALHRRQRVPLGQRQDDAGVDKADFELWSLAVSAINGCGKCIDAHNQVLRQAGVPREAIQQAVRIAAVIHAVAATLDGETSLTA